MKILIELIIILVILLLIIMFLSYKIIINKFNIYNIKINKSKNNLVKDLNKKFELTLKIIDFLHNKITIDEDEINEFLNINLQKIEMEELNDILIKTDKFIDKYLVNNEKLINNNDFIELNKPIKELNIKINAIRKYYNETVKEYNQSVNKYPTKIIAKIKKFSEKDKLKEYKGIH